MKQIYIGSAYTISKHAITRMKSRKISISDIDFIINQGLFERSENDRAIYHVTRPPALPPPDKLGFHHSTVSSAECEHTALPTDDQWKIIESI
ncbi:MULTISPECIES: DUF4258 domain-containing protein, partial [unclassified Oceanispirochaeta]|uniref:DUF4258 domain-containing protein n=1 Tax=unclassified Oceanispirochaeta TaxID=2635722 RepID=UPI000E099B18